MSAIFQPVPPRSFLITLDTLEFHAQSWSLSATCTYAEQGSVTGGRYLTNAYTRARVLRLKGSFFYKDDPAQVVLPLDTLLTDKTRLAFSLRGVRYFAVTITSYTLSEEATRGVLDCTLEMLVTTPLTEAPAETETGTDTDTETEDTTDTTNTDASNTAEGDDTSA